MPSDARACICSSACKSSARFSTGTFRPVSPDMNQATESNHRNPLAAAYDLESTAFEPRPLGPNVEFVNRDTMVTVDDDIDSLLRAMLQEV
jgi:hypothetical protein